MPEPGPVLQERPLLRSEPRYGALVCLQCNNGFPRGPILIRHLRRQHRLKADVYRPALRPFEHEPLAEDWNHLGRPPDESAPIEGLEMRRGFACIRCNHLTTSEDVIRGHLKCGEGQIRRVHLQCWNPSGADKYWIVTPSPSPPAADGSLPSHAGSFLSFSHQFLMLMMCVGPSLQQIAIEKVLRRERRLEEAEESRRIEANGSDDISIWHKWMKWTDTFREKDLAVRKVFMFID